MSPARCLPLLLLALAAVAGCAAPGQPLAEVAPQEFRAELAGESGSYLVSDGLTPGSRLLRPAEGEQRGADFGLELLRARADLVGDALEVEVALRPATAGQARVTRVLLAAFACGRPLHSPGDVRAALRTEPLAKLELEPEAGDGPLLGRFRLRAEQVPWQAQNGSGSRAIVLVSVLLCRSDGLLVREVVSAVARRAP